MKEKDTESLTEEDRRALRGSRFSCPLPPLPSASTKPRPSKGEDQLERLAHPGGPYTTNKAAALAKFLERKLQEPGGLNSIDSALVEAAVRDAKDTLNASCSSGSSKSIKHVTSFPDCTEEDCSIDEDMENPKSKKKKKAKQVKGTKKPKKKKKRTKHS